MDNVLLSVLAAVNVAILASVLAAWYVIHRSIKKARAWWQWWSTSPGKDSPAPWEQQLTLISASFAKAAVIMAKTEFQTTAAGVQSGMVRGERARKKTITEALIEGALGAIGGKLGQAVMPMLGQVNPLGQSEHAEHSGNHRDEPSSDFGRL